MGAGRTAPRRRRRRRRRRRERLAGRRGRAPVGRSRASSRPSGRAFTRRGRRRSWPAAHVLGVVGEVDPETLQAYDLPHARVGFLELELAKLAAAPRRALTARPVSRFPSSDVDLAFVVADSVPAAAIEAVLTKAAGDLVRVGRVCSTSTGERACRGLAQPCLSPTFLRSRSDPHRRRGGTAAEPVHRGRREPAPGHAALIPAEGGPGLAGIARQGSWRGLVRDCLVSFARGVSAELSGWAEPAGRKTPDGRR